MARIPLVHREEASPEIQAEYDKIVQEHGVVTNMKATCCTHPQRCTRYWSGTVCSIASSRC